MKQTGIVRKESESPEERGVALSRRSFIEVAVGTLAALPVVSGGLALPIAAEKAHAVDTTIVVAKLDEAAIVVMDMAGKKRTPVEGARVVLKSCFNGKTVEGKTNDKGTVLLGIAALAEDEGKKKKPAKYEFDAEIEVTKEGYRVFRTGRTHIEGAHGIAAPTRKLEPGVPYPSRVTLDKWDVLYTANEFCVTAKNDMRHSMRIDLENLSGSNKVTVTLYAGDKFIASGTATPSNGSCSVELREHFLLKTAKKVLPEGENFSIRYDQDGQEFRAPVALKICTARGGVEEPGINRNFSLSPFSEGKGAGSHKTTGISFPSGIPIIGGQTLPIWKPEFNNIDYAIDPFGYAYFAVRTSDWGYKSEDGKRVGKMWQAHPRASVSEQINKVWEEAGSFATATAQAWDKGTAKPTHAKLMRKFEATVMIQVSLVAKWGKKENDLIRLRFGVQAALSINFSLAWQFMVVYIPLVLEFSMNTSLTVGFNIAGSTPVLDDFDQWAIDYTNSSAISFTIDISPSLSLGIGIKGLFTVSFKGVYTLTIFRSRGPLPENRPADVQNPHTVVGMAFSTSIVIQSLFVTIPFKLPMQMSEPDYYNSWKGGYKEDYTKKDLAAQAAEELANISFLELVNRAFAEGDAYQLTEDDFKDIAEDVELEINYDAFAHADSVDAFTETCMLSGTNQETDLLITEQVYSADLGSQAVPDGSGSLMAGSSPALKAQDAGVASGDWGGSIMTYRDERKRRNFLFDSEAVAKAGVKRKGSRTGLVPNAVEVLESNAFGDPRTQVHKMFGRNFIFRLGIMSVKSWEVPTGGRVGPRRPGSVDVHSVCRSRIVCEGSFDGIHSYICSFDFDPWVYQGPGQNTIRIDRSQYDDYAFDMLVREKDSNTVELHFFIISGKRDESANRLAYLASDQVFCYVLFEMNRKTMRAERKSDLCYRASAHNGDEQYFDAAKGGTKFPYHHYSCPQITLLEDSIGNTSQTGLMFTYLDRAAVSREKILSQDENEVRIGVGFYYETLNNGLTTFSEDDEINQTVFTDLKDYSVYQMTVMPRCGTDRGKGVGWYIVMLKGAYTYYFLVEAGAMAASRRSSSGDLQYYAAGCRQPRLFGVYDRDAEKDAMNGGGLWPLAAPAQIVSWPNHEGYLASFMGKLMHVKLQNLVRPAGESDKYSVPDPRFTFTEVGPEKINVSAFGVDDDGQFLYYPAVREGTPGFRYDDKGGSRAKKDIEEHDVMACRLRDGKFCDPFVFCEVDYDMDTLVACGSQKSVAMSFISTNLVDSKKSKAEIRFTGMPYVRCANVIAFTSVADYAFPGIASPFNLTIRNEGNVYLSGCSIRLHKRGAKDDKGDTLTKIVFSKDTLAESAYNPKKADGTFENVEPDYSLAPGKTSTYSVMLVIPKNWEGKVNASVTAQDFVAASSTAKRSANGLSVQSDEPLVAQAETSDASIGGGSTAEADEGVFDFDGGYEGVDYDEYEDDVDYIEYDDYEDDGPEYDENGNLYVDYIVKDSDYDDDDLLDYPYDSVDVLAGEGVAGSELSDAPVVVPNTGKSGNRGSGLPQLGDKVTGADLALLAAAGASAAMAAYSKRRVENERAAAAGAADEDPASEE